MGIEGVGILKSCASAGMEGLEKIAQSQTQHLKDVGKDTFQLSAQAGEKQATSFMGKIANSIQEMLKGLGNILQECVLNPIRSLLEKIGLLSQKEVSKAEEIVQGAGEQKVLSKGVSTKEVAKANNGVHELTEEAAPTAARKAVEDIVEDFDGQFLAHRHAQAGDLEALKELSPQNVPSYKWNSLSAEKKAEWRTFDLNREDYNAHTPLMHAAKNGHKDVVEYLLKEGAKTDPASGVLGAGDKGFKTALHCALENGHTDIAQLLIEKGAAIEAKDAAGKTVVHYLAENGKGDLLKTWTTPADGKKVLLKEELLHIPDKAGNTPFHYAANKGDTKLMETLKTKKSLDLPNAEGKHPLHLAAQKGDMETIKKLVELGADPWLANPETESTLFHILAERKDNGTALREALEHFKGKQGLPWVLNLKNKVGDAAIHLAGCNGDIATTLKLLEHGADINARNAAGNTVAHTLAENIDKPQVRKGLKQLIKESKNNKLDLNAQNKNGKTLLHTLTEWENSTDMVKLLLEQKGINPNLQFAKSGNTALHTAILDHDVETVKALLPKSSLEIKNKEGLTAKGLAATLEAAQNQKGSAQQEIHTLIEQAMEQRQPEWRTWAI